MSLWWLQPGWEEACCLRCGANIKSTGGDPDWGFCYPCTSDRVERRHQPAAPPCDICGEYEAVTDSCGYAVCSEACHFEAMRNEGDREIV